MVEELDEALLNRIRNEHPEFQKWEYEHSDFEKTLADLDGHLHLGTEEELRRKHLQKMKLATKDKIMSVVRQYKTGKA